LFQVRRGQAAAADVVAVGKLVDRLELSSVAGGNGGLEVLAGAVEVRDERDAVVAEVVARGVLEALEDAVVVVAEEVDALVPGDCGDVGQQSEGELGIGLAAAALLALAGRLDDDMLDPAVAGAGDGVPDRVLEHHPVVAEHRDGDDRLQRGDIPVAVGKQRVAGERAVPDLAEGLTAPLDVRRGPAVVPAVE
jgi:hypothetical protein